MWFGVHACLIEGFADYRFESYMVQPFRGVLTRRICTFYFEDTYRAFDITRWWCDGVTVYNHLPCGPKTLSSSEIIPSSTSLMIPTAVIVLLMLAILNMKLG